MWAEVGHFALALGFAVAIVGALVIAAPATKHDSSLPRDLALAQSAALMLAFTCLILAFVQSDFSVTIVAANSHDAKPLFYKIAGAWGNHEGSMLLWAVLLSVYIALFSRYANISDATKRLTLVIACIILAATLAFIIVASNPFERLDPAPLNGRGLNPLLQDPALAIHPPVLYAGYVGLAIPYALSIAALLAGDLDKNYVREMLLWTALPMAFLTLGVGLGSWWAYRELGWGGWWFWDPVENASVLPWLCGAALLHSVLIAKKTGALLRVSALLGVVTFSMSVLGTFLVRSGVLTSVHSFAVDPQRGRLILAFLCLVLVGGLAVFAWKFPSRSKSVSWSAFSRFGAINAGILLFTVIAGSVLVGTLYPLANSAVSVNSISVGAPYFNATATPLGWLLLFIMAAAPLLAQDRGTSIARIKKIKVTSARLVVLVIPIVAGGSVVIFYKSSPGDALLFGLAVAIVCAVLWRVLERVPRTLSDWGMVSAHGGAAVALVGMAGAAFFSTETIESVEADDKIVIAGRTLTFNSIKKGEGRNYIFERAHVTVSDEHGRARGALFPERRFYPAGEMVTSEAVIIRNVISDLYVTLGDLRTPGADQPDWALRVYHRPFISWIWVGCLGMSFGVFMSAAGAATHRARRIEGTTDTHPSGSVAVSS